MSIAWWHEKAACNGHADDVFFPAETPGAEERAARTANARYCRKCPVRPQCLDSAIKNSDVGVWAGTTAHLRKLLRNKRDRIKCPACNNTTLATLDSLSFCTACGISWRTETKSDGSGA